MTHTEREQELTLNVTQAKREAAVKPTLRDQFAMAALSGATQPKNSYEFDDIAEWAYKIADAMMKARGE